jgi:hypothetical protein
MTTPRPWESAAETTLGPWGQCNRDIHPIGGVAIQWLTPLTSVRPLHQHGQQAEAAQDHPCDPPEDERPQLERP